MSCLRIRWTLDLGMSVSEESLRMDFRGLRTTDSLTMATFWSLRLVLGRPLRPLLRSHTLPSLVNFMTVDLIVRGCGAFRLWMLKWAAYRRCTCVTDLVWCQNSIILVRCSTSSLGILDSSIWFQTKLQDLWKTKKALLLRENIIRSHNKHLKVGTFFWDTLYIFYYVWPIEPVGS